MTYQTRILDGRDLTPALGQAWDALPARRGVQADYFDSYAWLSAWYGATVPRMAAGLRIPAVMDGDRPLALLPMVAWSARRWESVGRDDERNRYRPVLASERPDEEVLGLLAEGVARAGPRPQPAADARPGDRDAGRRVGPGRLPRRLA